MMKTFKTVANNPRQLFRELILLVIKWIRFMSVIFIPFCFLVLGAFVFWSVSQGKDLIQIVIDSERQSFTVYVSLMLWTMVTWYSTRIIFSRNKFIREEIPDEAERITPRLMGYLCITVIEVALLRIRYPEIFTEGVVLLSVVISILLFNVQGRLGRRIFFMKREDYRMVTSADNNMDADSQIEAMKPTQRAHKFLKSGRYVLLFMFFGLLMIPQIVWLKVFALMLTQAVLQFMFIAKRSVLFWSDETITPHNGSGAVSWFKKNNRLWMKFFSLPLFTSEEKDKLRQMPDDQRMHELIKYESTSSFMLFSFFSAISFLGFVVASFWMEVTVCLGSVAVVLVSFSVLLGIFNILLCLGSKMGINIFVVTLIISYILGFFSDGPHELRICKKSDIQNAYYKRQGLPEYFTRWIEKRNLMADTVADSSLYPVYIVLSDGGASRSGYWVASVLGKMHDETDGAFSDHLLCLSGASGGSVGNATYFSLLAKKSESSFLDASKQFLASDFLSHTISNMLSTDILTTALPIISIDDRSVALETSLEHPSSGGELDGYFSTPFSWFLTQEKNDYDLPILFLNTTRVQDARPSIVSNVLIDETTFSGRLDVLGLLHEDEDINLSTAVILGARFPYVSPAGGIRNDYFVDGGYFDNSGAGVVTELLLKFEKLSKDTSMQQKEIADAWSRLRFRVIHISNSKPSPETEALHPLVNELFAPIQTLAGSYGMQTTVNDERLKRYLNRLNNDQGFDSVSGHRYMEVNLYPDDVINTDFAMNWVLSDTTLARMDSRLKHSHQLDSLISLLQSELK